MKFQSCVFEQAGGATTENVCYATIWVEMFMVALCVSVYAQDGERNVLRCRGEKGEENEQSTKKWCENYVFLCYSATADNLHFEAKLHTLQIVKYLLNYLENHMVILSDDSISIGSLRGWMIPTRPYSLWTQARVSCIL